MRGVVPLLRGVGPCVLVLLQGCFLLGPGADGDDEGDSDSVGGGFAIAGGSAREPASPAPRERSWFCIENTTSCECTPSGGTDDVCELDWGCCISTEDSCECSEDEACDAQVASRPGSARVPACPPGAESRPVACAADGVNCSPSYLHDEGLAGCCEGLLCTPNDAGVRVCQPGTAEELSLQAQCLDPRTGITLDGQLESSLGPLPFDTVDRFEVEAGTGGCLRVVRADLSGGGGSFDGCVLYLTAGPQGDGSGNLLLERLTLRTPGLMESCPGFPDALQGAYLSLDGGLSSSTLSFSGLSCEGVSVGAGGLCYAGTFELRLRGSTDATSLGTLTFDDAVLRFEGRACSVAARDEPCP